MDAVLAPLKRWPNQQPVLFLAVAAAAWFRPLPDPESSR